MTYKESYMQCQTEKDLLEISKNDIEVALLMGSYARVSVIKRAVEEVITEKFDKGGNDNAR